MVPSVDLQSFGPEITALVVGARGGIGQGFVEALLDQPSITKVYGTSRHAFSMAHPKFTPLFLNLKDETSIEAAAATVSEPLSLIIIASGLLHDGALQPEKSLRDLDPAHMAETFAINAIGPALVAKHFLPKLPKTGKSVFAALSARVGSISANQIGGWHSYRASKAALNMYLKNISLEAGRKYKDLVVVGLQPGTVATELSQPFQSNVKEGKLFTPAFAARSMLNVLDGLSPQQTGRLYDWSGAEFQP